MKNKIEIILGPPGTGKTEALLKLVEYHLQHGVKPEEIGFLAFTKKAATEAKQRAMTKFKLTERQLPYFRTIHSLVFRQLSLSKVQVMQFSHYRELGDKLSIDITGYTDMTEGSAAYGMGAGDRLIFMEGLARAKMIPLRQQWELSNSDDVDWWELDRVSRGLVKYKESNGLIDFTDMLHLFVQQGYVPKLKVLLIDEAQDLSALQWKVVNILVNNTDKVYVAGDDDQSIFAWAGSDTDYFINLDGKVRVLDSSFRVPRLIKNVALDIVTQIHKRRPKAWLSHPTEGDVTYHNSLDTVPLETGSWLLLARNGYMLREFEDHCMTSGFSFEGKQQSPLKSPTLTAILNWEHLRKGEELSVEQFKKVLALTNIKGKRLDLYNTVNMHTAINYFGMHDRIWHEELVRISPYEREYFIAARRHGETLVNKPRIMISTIHGAKGGEADNVLLLTDLAPRTYSDMQVDFDNELRVFYVAVTRAHKSLHIILPRTNRSFNI